MLSAWLILLCFLATGAKASSRQFPPRQNANHPQRSLHDQPPLFLPPSRRSTVEPILEDRSFSSELLHTFDLTHRAVDEPIVTVAALGFSVGFVCDFCVTFGTASVTTTGFTASDSFFDDLKDELKRSIFDRDEDGIFDRDEDGIFDRDEDDIFHRDDDIFHRDDDILHLDGDIFHRDDDLFLRDDDFDFSKFLEEHITTAFHLSFFNTSATLNFTTQVAAAGTHAFNLLLIPVPQLGAAVKWKNSVNSIGLTFTLDLLLTLTGEINVTTAIDFAVPEGASITFDPVGGEFISSQGFENFGDLIVPHFKFQGESGVEMEVSLRATLFAGLTIGVDIGSHDFDADFGTGVFLDLPAYHIKFTNGTDCEGSGGQALQQSAEIAAGVFGIAESDFKDSDNRPSLPGQWKIWNFLFPSNCV